MKLKELKKKFSTLETYNIIIAGVGGQGNLLVSELIAKSAIKNGYRVVLSETYGAAQRGGAVNSHIRIGKNLIGPMIPEGNCDILLAFEPMEAIRMGTKFLNKNSIVIMNSHPILPTNVLSGEAKYPDVNEILSTIKEICNNVISLDATNIAIDIGEMLVVNTIMLGALFGMEILPLEKKDLLDIMKSRLLKRYFDVNQKAFDLGYSKVQKNI
ncbi:MAG: indolepyruvate ferredoxin oxidoreductase subunit beta [Candidatus Ranarchaeia archaeon]